MKGNAMTSSVNINRSPFQQHYILLFLKLVGMFKFSSLEEIWKISIVGHVVPVGTLALASLMWGKRGGESLFNMLVVEVFLLLFCHWFRFIVCLVWSWRKSVCVFQSSILEERKDRHHITSNAIFELLACTSILLWYFTEGYLEIWLSKLMFFWNSFYTMTFSPILCYEKNQKG